MSEALIDSVRAHMRTVKAPSHYDKVYKDECMFSYATPEAPDGLFINMQTWQVRCGPLYAPVHILYASHQP